MDGPLVGGIPVSGGPTRLGVVGAGVLGLTVVRAAAVASPELTVLVRPGTLARRFAAVEDGLALDVERGRLDPATAAAVLRRLRVTEDPGDLADVDVVIESTPEDVAGKQAVVAVLEQVVRATTVIASTTSSIPAGVLAAGARRPERFAVAHYIWPAHRVSLVEVAFAPEASPRTRRVMADVLAAQGKVPLVVADRAGFLLTRALYAYWNAVLELLRDGCPPGRVDAALRAFGWPMGPLRVMDGASLATVVCVHDQFARHLDVRWDAVGALGEAVRAGATSVYRGPSSDLADPGLLALLTAGRQPTACSDAQIVARTTGALAREVERAVGEGVAAWDEAERAVALAFGFPARRGSLRHWRMRDAVDRAAWPVPVGIGAD